MSGKIVAGVRSLVFMLFFYPVTALFVLLCALFAPFSARMLRRCGRLWGQTHRVLCRVVLGQRVRILGTLRHGVIGLKRGDGAKAVRYLRAEALKATDAGRPICLFPEGTRVPHGEQPPIRAGFAALYHLLRLPVVPVALDSGRLSPRHSFFKWPGVITYQVGEIIPAGLPRDEAEARAHRALNALNRA